MYFCISKNNFNYGEKMDMILYSAFELISFGLFLFAYYKKDETMWTVSVILFAFLAINITDKSIIFLNAGLGLFSLYYLFVDLFGIIKI